MSIFNEKRERSIGRSLLWGLGGLAVGAAGMFVGLRHGPGLRARVTKLVRDLFVAKTGAPTQFELDRMEDEGGAAQPGRSGTSHGTSDGASTHS